MNIKPELQTKYEEYVAINSGDDYSKAVIEAGEAVGKALDEGKTPEEAEKALHGFGLTGYMAGAAASAVAHYHVRGEEFRVWWNKQYNVESESGTVNPAILTVKDE